MREIKFRVFKTQFTRVGEDNIGEMVYDVVLANSLWNTADIRVNDILSKTHNLMQFTGLLDKLGKEVYENDIILWENSDGELVKDRVVFCKGAFRMRNMSFTLYDYMDSNIFEVIGNIYQTPELLEQI